MMDQSEQGNCWDEGLSQEFIDFGRYFVPEREHQIEIIVDLLPQLDGNGRLIELCCGEGLLAEAILERYPNYQVIGFDGSQEMLNRAQLRLARFGEQFHAQMFDLADHAWRKFDEPIQAVVTSLAVHHLAGPEKKMLFRDVTKMLVPGGVFIIADMIDPIHPKSKKLAAAVYDAIVREQSMLLDGNTRAFDYFRREGWNIFDYLDPEDIDKPSPLYDQLKWLEQVGFKAIEVFWMRAGHAIFGGWKPE
jgi:tRNA (cmo5U34)-methyltransferase